MTFDHQQAAIAEADALLQRAGLPTYTDAVTRLYNAMGYAAGSNGEPEPEVKAQIEVIVERVLL